MKTETVNSEQGGFLCRGTTLPSLGKDQGFSYIYSDNDHEDEELAFEITGDGQVAVTEFIIYLKDCE